MSQDSQDPKPNEANNNPQETINEQILRTIRYTGKTNAEVMKTQSAVLEMAGNVVATAKAQEKIARMRFFLFAIPIAFMVIFYAKTWYTTTQINNFDDGHVAQVKISGAIREDSSTAGAGAVLPALNKAFKDDKALGILIQISSPGGSPGQSEQIRDEILRLRGLYPDKKVAVIATEMMASGGYWIATAAPEIYAMRTTYVGSIGVIGSSFNYSELIDKLGVKRLVMTSGKSKSKLDSFLPIKEQDVKKQKELMNGIHADFIDVVKASRGDKLIADDDTLFNGDYWRGQQAYALGLIDGVTTPTRLLMEKFGTENVIDYSKKPGMFENILPSINITINKDDVPMLIEVMEHDLQ
jgi:protease-4